MLPITDFNFVVAGIATFAATVGYACTRRHGVDPSGLSPDEVRNAFGSGSILSNEPSEAQAPGSPEMPFQRPAGPASTNPPAAILLRPSPRRESLKRKVPHDGFDEPEKPVKAPQELGYPHNLANIYPPNKRSKTPSTEVEVNTPPRTQTPDLGTEVVEDIIPLTSEVPESIIVACTPAPEPPRTPTPVPEEWSSIPPSSTLPVFTAPEPAPQIPTVPMTPKPAAFKTFATPSGGFAAFAGTASPFASITKPQSSLKQGRTIWNSAPSDLATYPNDALSGGDALDDPFKPVSPTKSTFALEETKPAASPPIAKHAHITGEEEEDVEMELKNLKLYVKRGEKNFGEGIMGHLKLLSHRTTLEERLLFRREPLWKVSMNVRVQPAVRCLFVPEENALKLILKEDATPSKPSMETTKDAEKQQDLVIYVLKPGRSCPKQDFRDFAQTLVKNSQFNPATGATATV